ncbi:hypothetical protein ON010_g16371 [Phytophthora cinnamomi]|nr:hypothetical protein ON010_g16371 [Phytophthora cinnamomi]
MTNGSGVVKAVEGFFAPKKVPAAELSLFKRFERVSPSWGAFQQQFELLLRDKRNVKVVYLVRHAQGTHNVAEQKYGVGRWEDELARTDEFLDPDLTPFGVEDTKAKGPPSIAAELQQGMPPIERVVVSPLSRTIQTAQTFFAKDQTPAVGDQAQVPRRRFLADRARTRRALVAHAPRDRRRDLRASEVLPVRAVRRGRAAGARGHITASLAVADSAAALPQLDEQGETLKKEQQYPMFRHRSAYEFTVNWTFVFNVGNRMGAILLIQQLYRRYRRMRSWHEVSEHMLQLARGRLAAQRAQEQDNISAASFRLLLAEGFSASKVCISGALKTIQLKLVLNTEAGECYLTWTPSRKKKPQINLHDIDQVIPVLKEGNPEAPRLSKKVSYRRGIIIACRSYHRGRVVLELATKRERNILLQGFHRLLSEMVATEPTLDDVGALRSQHPRRQSVIEFFSTSEEPLPASPHVITTSLSPRRGSVAMYRPEPLATGAPHQPHDSIDLPPHSVTDSVRADAKAIEHFYQTRFDESPDNTMSIPQPARRPSRGIEARH